MAESRKMMIPLDMHRPIDSLVTKHGVMVDYTLEELFKSLKPEQFREVVELAVLISFGDKKSMELWS